MLRFSVVALFHDFRLSPFTIHAPCDDLWRLSLANVIFRFLFTFAQNNTTSTAFKFRQAVAAVVVMVVVVVVTTTATSINRAVHWKNSLQRIRRKKIYVESILYCV